MTDDTIRRELDAVDDALATGTTLAVDPIERELRELAVALQAEAPTPDPAFAGDLRAKVTAGFPRERRRPFGNVGALFSPTGLGLSAVAAVVIAIVVVVSIGGRDSRLDGAGSGAARAVSGGGAGSLASGEAGSPDQGSVARDDAGSGAQGDAGATAETAPGAEPAEPDSATIGPADPPRRGGGGFQPGREQRIARSAALTLAAPGDRLDTLSDRVIAVTDRHRGYVLESSVTAGDGLDAGGTLELRVPADRLRAVLRDLSALASVRSSTQAGEDVTGRFVGARDRLAAAKAERVSLLRRLEDAETDTQANALRARLDIVAAEINGIASQLRRLRLRTNYAAITVSLEPKRDDGSAVPTSTEDALDDSLAILQGAFNAALRIAAVLLPLALLAGAAWLVSRALLRRRRESALGA